MPRIKDLLAAGKTVRMLGVGQLISPKLIEIAAEHSAYDAIWLDFEHAGITMREVELATLATRAYGLDSFVRLPATDYASTMRALEAGAGGVMFSMVRSAAEVEQGVRWAKFAPRGQRGLNGGNRDGHFGLEPLEEYVKRANQETFVGVQIETPEAIEQIEAIAGIPDVDLLFIGPVDLSMLLGVPGQFDHPTCLETIDRIAAACARAGKPWGIVPRGPEYAARMAERGCRLFVFAFDIHVVHAGIRALRERYSAFYRDDKPPRVGPLG
jgi:2-dehydro-3-deoxyglucarate aldolase/4-hydroxy-2-oxoheptanedioate aldolase